MGTSSFSSEIVNVVKQQSVKPLFMKYINNKNEQILQKKHSDVHKHKLLTKSLLPTVAPAIKLKKTEQLELPFF